MKQRSTWPFLHSIAAAVCAIALVVPITSMAGPADHEPESKVAADAGPQGGMVTRDGQDAVELSLTEKEGRSRLLLWGYRDAKEIPPGAMTATATLTRPNGFEQDIVFAQTSNGLASTEDIAEPHFFDIAVEVSWPGRDRPLKAELHKDEGLIALSAEQIAAAGIVVKTADTAELESSLRFPGEIKFNADRTAHVVPRVPGIVQEVFVDLGQQVKKGEVLASISSTVLAELRSEWLAASKRSELAVITFRREKKLWQEKVSAEQDFQQARTALQEAQIAVRNAEQKLRAIGAEPQARDLSLLTIRAPFDGMIVEKHITLGEALSDTASIFTLSDLGTVWAEFIIAPKDLQHVRVGEDAKITSTSFSEAASGKVSYIGSLLGQQTRTATARVTLDNPGIAWRPGLFVSVDVVVERDSVPVAVDSDAIQTLEEGPVVFIEVPGGFIPQPVVAGNGTGEMVEVESGLRVGTRYVASNAFILKSEMGKDSADHSH
ncbi:cobalt-zinc-cadmium resistance protein CzcB [Bordetella bronchiseptica F4563]|uniref:efflux RND transporter periplasmic adaptor subunit n=1 Tax=Bordetella bronchiseptica TaxID=518 RepID=UPI0004611435|nr:efflux RND transporter periplasmic adaptor subunit [Bordetella bronchiseptica]KDC32811.1 cobalt-zinc-cadmium resistance protein CzcB [Bordetella bronchiseptica F4563]